MDLNTINEEWFQEQLGAAEIDMPELVLVFIEMANAERGNEADGWAQTLFQKFSESGDAVQALLALEWLAIRGAVTDVKTAVEKLLSNDRNALKMIEPAGFSDKKVTLEECFKRLTHLRALKVGMLCYNATWGFGIVEHIDYFYQQLEVDFERKGEHEMAFSYASHALEALAEDHILAIKHNNPAELERMIKEEPAEVVRITLRSYGGMPVTRLQETLTPSVLPDAKWKKFWEGTYEVA